MSPEAALRGRLGRLCALFGLAHLLPVAFVALSSGGPSPVSVPARAWSLFFYGHFAALAAAGLGLQGWAAMRSRLFYGGPLIDFLLGVTGFMLLESAAAEFLRRGSGGLWAMLVPGLALFAFGVRLALGRPLLRG